MSDLQTIYDDIDTAAGIRISPSEQTILDIEAHALSLNALTTLITLLESGSAGQVLTSDGAGNYTWETP